MKKIAINIPKLIKVDDYHKLDEVAKTLNNLAGTQVKSIEIGYEFNKSEYVSVVGILYTGQKPSLQEIKKLVAKEKIPLGGGIELHKRIRT